MDEWQSKSHNPRGKQPVSRRGVSSHSRTSRVSQGKKSVPRKKVSVPGTAGRGVSGVSSTRAHSARPRPASSRARGVPSSQARAVGASRASSSARRPTPTVRRSQPVTTPTRFWLRRVLVLCVLAGLVALVGVGVHTAKNYYRAIQEQQRIAIQKQALANRVVEPVECSAKTLKTSLSLSATSVTSGNSVDASVRLLNSSQKVPCYMLASFKEVGIRVTSGDTHVFSSIPCHGDDPDMKILLGAGESYDRAISWDGYVYSESCERQDKAQPGSYKVVAVVNGQAMSEPVTLEVN